MPSPFHSVMHPLEIKPLDFLCLRAECQKLLITSEKFFSFPLLRVETHPRPIARLQEASDCVTTRSEPTAASSQMKGTMMMIIVLDEQFRNQTLLASGFLWFSWKIFQRLLRMKSFFLHPLKKHENLFEARREEEKIQCGVRTAESEAGFHFTSSPLKVRILFQSSVLRGARTIQFWRVIGAMWFDLIGSTTSAGDPSEISLKSCEWRAKALEEKRGKFFSWPFFCFVTKHATLKGWKETGREKISSWRRARRKRLEGRKICYFILVEIIDRNCAIKDREVDGERCSASWVAESSVLSAISVRKVKKLFPRKFSQLYSENGRNSSGKSFISLEIAREKLEKILLLHKVRPAAPSQGEISR